MQEFPRGVQNYTQSIDARYFLYTAHLHFAFAFVFYSAYEASLRLCFPSLSLSLSLSHPLSLIC